VDHFIVLGEAHLRHILRTYARYYNNIRTHWSLDKDAPVYRPVQRIGSINSHAILGGLHHHYVSCHTQKRTFRAANARPMPHRITVSRWAAPIKFFHV
jgi:hypothetical protein